MNGYTLTEILEMAKEPDSLDVKAMLRLLLALQRETVMHIAAVDEKLDLLDRRVADLEGIVEDTPPILKLAKDNPKTAVTTIVALMVLTPGLLDVIKALLKII